MIGVHRPWLDLRERLRDGLRLRLLGGMPVPRDERSGVVAAPPPDTHRTPRVRVDASRPADSVRRKYSKDDDERDEQPSEDEEMLHALVHRP